MALDTYAIITLADLKATLGITVSTFDTQLEQAINVATHNIEQFIGHYVVERRVIEWTTSGGTGHVVVKHPPVGHVHYIGSGRMSAMTVDRTVATDIVNSVTLTDGKLTLTRVQADGTETISGLLFTTYKTSSALVTQINNTTGFSATLGRNCKAQYLHRFAGRDLTNASLTMTYADNGQLDTRVDNERGIIYLVASEEGGSWPYGDLSLVIDYDGGWATVPYAIEAACRSLAAGVYYSRQRDTTLSSESLGDYSYTLQGGAASESEAMQMLAPYKRYR
jgi:hypothetical protein